MEYQIDFKGTKATISLFGQFTFADNQRFRKAMNTIIDERPSHLSILLSGVTYVDSAALGMLLLLREAMQENNVDLKLCQPKDQVAKMFDISKFKDLFSIEP